MERTEWDERVTRAWKHRDSYLDGLPLMLRFYMESGYVGESRWRLDARRAGLRTQSSASRLVPVSVESDGTLRVTGTEASASIPISGRISGSASPDGWIVPGIAGFTLGCRPVPDLVKLLHAREALLEDRGSWMFAAEQVLALPWSARWLEATSTALLGNWADPLVQQQVLTPQAVSVLRAEARTIHRQLAPLWRRRTSHGRVLSLDADLGDGYCLYDLLTAQPSPHPDAAALATLIDDKRAASVLRALTALHCRVVLARAAGDSTTWTEAAAAVGANDPAALGNQVRRRVNRLIAEQRRRQHLSDNCQTASDRPA
ncbi:hypothetical protein ACIQWB_36775 [Streptomyces olivaceus]|uniref:hypothetical protein n=1 Tax=Streptomyces olivaceus TaxID=47716 RepID=UPI0038294166